MRSLRPPVLALHAGLLAAGALVLAPALSANSNVYVSRFWHNHQPIYWPEWNGNGGQTQRVQYAWDSILQKPWQNYGGLSPTYHPENDLNSIFGTDDRRNAYQSGPRNSLITFDNRGGFALSYSGSLIDNIRQLGGGGAPGLRQRLVEWEPGGAHLDHPSRLPPTRSGGVHLPPFARTASAQSGTAKGDSDLQTGLLEGVERRAGSVRPLQRFFFRPRWGSRGT